MTGGSRGIGFYKRRRGILEHLEAGKISLLDSGIHDYLSLKMNSVIGSGCSIPPGVIFTSARAICAQCSLGASEREVRRSLERLERLGWIKRWQTAGKHGNYPVLIARGSVYNSAGNEYRVNAEQTIDWREPVLILAATCPRDVRDMSSDRDLRHKKSKTPAAKSTPPDPRFQPIVDSYYRHTREVGIEPSCDPSDFSQLASWLTRNAKRPAEDILASLRHAFKSTDQFPLRTGFRLREFLQHEAKYQRGPLLKSTNRPVQTTTVPVVAPKNDLSPVGMGKIAEYGVAR